MGSPRPCRAAVRGVVRISETVLWLGCARSAAIADLFSDRRPPRMSEATKPLPIRPLHVTPQEHAAVLTQDNSTSGIALDTRRAGCKYSHRCWDGGSTIGALVWCAHSATAWFHEHTTVQMGSCIKRHGFGADGEVRTTSVRRVQHVHIADPPVFAAHVVTPKEPFCPLIASAPFRLRSPVKESGCCTQRPRLCPTTN
jgi:hypothetical protein